MMLSKRIFLEIYITYAFNINPDPIFYESTTSGEFGRSLTFWKNGAKPPVLLIGAPRKNTILKCSIQNKTCLKVPLKLDINENALSEDEGLGTSLEVQEDSLITCSPRYTIDVVCVKNNNRSSCKPSQSATHREIPGRCFKIPLRNKNREIVKKLTPCSIKDGNGNGQRGGFCQAGSGGVKTSKNGKVIFIGSPGENYGQGQVNALGPMKVPMKTDDWVKTMSFENRSVLKELSKGISNNTELRLRYNKKQQLALTQAYVKYMEKYYDSGHFGISMAPIELDENAETSEILIGAVHRDRWEIKGKVFLGYLRENEFEAKKYLTSANFSGGSQMGEQFGYAISVADFDRDGLEDVAISAPTWSDLTKPETANYGRVYIFKQKKTLNGSSFETEKILQGEVTGGHFGWALASSDLDQDGYPDLLVSAPFYEESGANRGRIYVFNGSPWGIRAHFSQILRPKTVNSGIQSKAFGAIIATYKNSKIAVGDFQSNQVWAFNFTSAMKIEARFERMNLPILGGQNEFDCSRGANCWKLCLRFKGKGVPSKQIFRITSDLDSEIGRIKCDESSVFCPTHSSIDLTLQARKDAKKCTPNVKLRYIQTHENKILPVKILTKIQPVENTGFVLDPNSDTILENSLRIFKECSKENGTVCDSQLDGVMAQIKPSKIPYFSIPEKEDLKSYKMKIHITVLNDPSYNTKLYMQHPVGANFSKISKFDDSDTATTKINYDWNHEDFLLVASLGNPLPKGHHTFELSWYIVASGESPIETFKWHVNNTNDGPSSEKIGQDLNLQVQVGTKVDISVENKRMIFQQGAISDDFTNVEHLYMIENRGPVDISKAKIVIEWPERTIYDRKILSYKGIVATTVPFATEVNCTQKSSEKNVQNFSGRKLGPILPDPKTDLIDYGCVGGSAKCAFYTCDVANFDSSSRFELRIQGQLDLVEFKRNLNSSKFTSELTFRVEPSWYKTGLLAQKPVKEVKTFDTRILVQASPIVYPLWIVIVSSGVGVTLIALLFTICYKIGWFDRRDFREYDQLIPVYTAEKIKPNIPSPQRLTFDLIMKQ